MERGAERRRARERLWSRVTAIGLCGALALTACGSRVEHEDVLSAHRASLTVTREVPTEPTERADGPSGRPASTPSVAEPGSATTADTVAEPSVETSAVPSGAGPANGAGAAADAPASSDEPSPSTAPQEPSGPATGEPIVLANIGTYSGIIGSILGTGQQGIQVWAADFNARGGIDGRPVEVVSADDGGDPARALSLAQDFVENRGAIAFVGNLTPLTTGAYRTYLEEQEVPVVGGDVLSADWYESPMLFPQGGSFVASTLGAAQLAADNGLTQFGSLVCVEVDAVCRFTEAILTERAAERGVDYVYKASVSLAQPDFTSECLGLERAGVQALLVILDGNSTKRFADDCAAQGYEPLVITNSLGLVQEVLTSPNVDGILSPAQTFPFVASDTPATQAFQDAYQRILGGPPTAGPHSSTWTAGKLFEAAAGSLPSDPTSRDVLEGLWALDGEDLDGLTGPLRFPPGQPAVPVDCYFLVGIGDGAFVAPDGSRLTCL